MAMTVHEVISADRLEQEAWVQLSMVENVRNGYIEAHREPGGPIEYSVTDAGRAWVEAMGSADATS